MTRRTTWRAAALAALLTIMALCLCGGASADLAAGTAGTLSWTLDDNGTLTIAGTGDIPDYAFHDTAGQSYSGIT